MSLKRIFRILSAIIITSSGMTAQNDKAGDRAWIFGASLSFNQADGNWSESFNNNISVGAHLARKTSSNLIFSAEWNYLTGGEITNRTQSLGSIIGDNGNLLNSSGSFAQYNINQRATYFSIGIEKVLPFWQYNLNSGPSLGLYGGYTWHWLNIDNVGNDAPQILEPYVYGYDRMSRGFHLSQSFGYMYLSESRLINFRISFDLNEIWSRDIRSYHYPSGTLSNDTQLNLLYSLKIKWYIPIYLGEKKEEYYYN